MSYQFVVINSCKDRKQKMIELFRQLNIGDSLIYYLEASTPENSEEYFIDTSFNKIDMKVICCAKSHCRAFEYATKEESPEFSIIVEDDAAFYKTDFVKIVQEIILNWEQYFNNCNYISLGWIPVNQYDNYKLKNNMKIQTITDINNKFVFFNDTYINGTQCYLVKKTKINKIAQLLNKSSYNEFKKALTHYIQCIHGINFTNFSTLAVDNFLNRIMGYQVMFPPLVIEQKGIKSLLGHDNANHYWLHFFTNHEEEFKNYMTY